MRNLASSFILGLANRVSREIESGYYQIAPVLAEYPKSGGSYLFFTLTHLIRNHKVYCDPVPHIYPSKRFSVDLDQATSSIARVSALRLIPSSPFPPLKTHTTYDSRYRSVLCLYRDPLSLMRSYYRFLTNRRLSSFSCLKELLYCNEYGIPAWLAFYKSYLDADLGSLIYFCDYTNLVNSYEAVIDDILRCIYGFSLNSEGVLFIRKTSTIDYGKKLEDRLSLSDPRRNELQRFIGSKTQVPGDMECLPDELHEKCQYMLARLRNQSYDLASRSSQ